MRPLDEQLRIMIDADVAPVTAEEAQRRGLSGAHARPRRWPVAVAAALALGLAVAAVAVFPTDDAPRPSVSTPHEPPQVGAAEWLELRTLLTGVDYSTQLFWTGDEVITISPDRGETDVTGERYRPADGTLRPIASSGLEWRYFPSMVWTGDEVIVAGGSNGPGITNAAAAYSPATDSWRALPPPPGFVPGGSESVVGGPAVWTGREMISWRSRLAFDPSANSWRAISDPPLSSRMDEAVAAIDGRVFVWGGCDRAAEPQCDETLAGDEFVDGAVYDPATDTWSGVPASPLGAGDHPTAVWTGREVVVTVHVPADSDQPSTAAYDPAAGTWRTLPPSPHPGGRYAVTVWTGDVAITQGGIIDGQSITGATTALDPESGKWFTLPDGPARDRHTAVWAGSQLVVAGGSPSSTPWSLYFENGKAALAPRPNAIAAVTTDDRLVVLDSETGEVLRELASSAVADSKDASGHWSLAATPDGSTIYFMRPTNGCADCLSIASVPAVGGPVTNPLEPGCCSRDPAVSPDGRWLAFSGVPNRSDAGRDLLLLDLTPGAQLAARRWTSDAKLTRGVGQLAWAPNSDQIAFVQADTPDGSYPRVLDINLPETEKLDEQGKVPVSDAMRWAGYLGATGDFLVISDASDELGESLAASGKPQRIAALDGQTGDISRVLFELQDAADVVSDTSGAHALATTADGSLYRWSQSQVPTRPAKIADGIAAAIWLPGANASIAQTSAEADTTSDDAIAAVVIFSEGECFTADAAMVSCAAPHTREDFATLRHAGSLTPSSPSSLKVPLRECTRLFEEYAGFAPNDLYGIVPTTGGSATEPGVLETRCSALSNSGLQPTTGSIRRADR